MKDDFQLPLDELATGERFVVCGVDPHANTPEWSAWLEDLGFLSGEQGRLMARGIPGGDPLVVRIGLSTFALRRAEACCVRVRPQGAPVPAVGLQEQPQ